MGDFHAVSEKFSVNLSTEDGSERIRYLLDEQQSRETHICFAFTLSACVRMKEMRLSPQKQA